MSTEDWGLIAFGGLVVSFLSKILLDYINDLKAQVAEWRQQAKEATTIGREAVRQNKVLVESVDKLADAMDLRNRIAEGILESQRGRK